MSQRQLTVAEYIAWTDLLSEAIKILFTAKGKEETPATAAYHCAAARNAITALEDPDEAKLTVDLLPAAMALVAKAELESDISSMFATFNSAVIGHLGANLNAWLQADGTRVSHWWRRGGNVTISPVNVFPPVTTLGSFAVTGSGAGVYTDSDEVETDKYGGAQIQLEVTGNTIGAAAIEVTVNCITASGGTVQRVGSIPAASAVGFTVDLGTSVDRIVDVTSITVTGGTNGDAFRVQTMEDARV
ncbi:MAG: hypothetical protein JXA87_07845 [Thermoleophilia bacterium]|nr:hypothetical protein [Thermoleophilia bacterium]